MPLLGSRRLRKLWQEELCRVRVFAGETHSQKVLWETTQTDRVCEAQLFQIFNSSKLLVIFARKRVLFLKILTVTVLWITHFFVKSHNFLTKHKTLFSSIFLSNLFSFNFLSVDHSLVIFIFQNLQNFKENCKYTRRILG